MNAAQSAGNLEHCVRHTPLQLFFISETLFLIHTADKCWRKKNLSVCSYSVCGTHREGKGGRRGARRMERLAGSDPPELTGGGGGGV